MSPAFKKRSGGIQDEKYKLITGCISILAVILLGICIVQGYTLNRMKETSISGIADSYQNFRTLIYNGIHRYQNEADTHLVGLALGSADGCRMEIYAHYRYLEKGYNSNAVSGDSIAALALIQENVERLVQMPYSEEISEQLGEINNWLQDPARSDLNQLSTEEIRQFLKGIGMEE